MTTKTINGKEFLFVQVPEKLVGEPYINEYSNLICFTEKPLCYPTAIKLPDGEWYIIGLASNLTEDEWKGIVERMGAGYLDYEEDDATNNIFYKGNALLSGQSLL